jgi:hypothetical protein
MPRWPGLPGVCSVSAGQAARRRGHHCGSSQGTATSARPGTPSPGVRQPFPERVPVLRGGLFTSVSRALREGCGRCGHHAWTRRFRSLPESAPAAHSDRNAKRCRAKGAQDRSRRVAQVCAPLGSGNFNRRKELRCRVRSTGFGLFQSDLTIKTTAHEGKNA